MKSNTARNTPPYHTDRLRLEREVRVETFRGGGPGGQHRNVTDSGVRLIHLPSGLRVVATESRSQHRNREVAFTRLIERLQALNRVRRPRVPTRVPRAVVERRLSQKKRRRTVKTHRAGIRNHERD